MSGLFVFSFRPLWPRNGEWLGLRIQSEAQEGRARRRRLLVLPVGVCTAAIHVKNIALCCLGAPCNGLNMLALAIESFAHVFCILGICTHNHVCSRTLLYMGRLLFSVALTSQAAVARGSLVVAAVTDQLAFLLMDLVFFGQMPVAAVLLGLPTLLVISGRSLSWPTSLGVDIFGDPSSCGSFTALMPCVLFLTPWMLHRIDQRVAPSFDETNIDCIVPVCDEKNNDEDHAAGVQPLIIFKTVSGETLLALEEAEASGLRFSEMKQKLLYLKNSISRDSVLVAADRVLSEDEHLSDLSLPEDWTPPLEVQVLPTDSDDFIVGQCASCRIWGRGGFSVDASPWLGPHLDGRWAYAEPLPCQHFKWIMISDGIVALSGQRETSFFTVNDEGVAYMADIYEVVYADVAKLVLRVEGFGELHYRKRLPLEHVVSRS